MVKKEERQWHNVFFCLAGQTRRRVDPSSAALPLWGRKRLELDYDWGNSWSRLLLGCF